MRYLIPVLVLAGLGVTLTVGSSFGAGENVFTSRRQAEDFLASALPEITKANPKYLTKAEGYESIWLTKSLRFDDLGARGLRVAMDEEYTQFKAGVATPGTHQAAFTLADVTITTFTEPGDVTPSGEPAMGILFTCSSPGCIEAAWGGQPSKADKTDISIQDPAMRAKALAAFVYLKSSN